MKRTLPFCILALLLAFACTARAQQPPPLHPFFPLKVGNQWTYRAGKTQVVVRVDKIVPLEFIRDEKTGDREKVTGFALKITNGPLESADHVAILADGVYRFTTAGKAIKPPLRFFKLPLEIKEQWKAEYKTEEGKLLKGGFVADAESLELTINGQPMKVATMRVTSKFVDPDEQESVVVYWFAKDYGMVKQYVRSGKHEMTLELEAFKAAP